MNIPINQQQSLSILIILSGLFNMFYYRTTWSSLIFFIILVYLMRINNVFEMINNTQLKTQNELNKDNLEFIESINSPISSSIYQISKEKYRFIHKDIVIQQLLYELHFINTYNKTSISTLTTLIERFLKIYYCLIADRYDKRYLDHMLDIRKEIINTLLNAVMSVPITNRRGDNLHNVIHKHTNNLMNWTSIKLRILKQKFPDFNYMGPKHYDNYSKFDVFV